MFLLWLFIYIISTRCDFCYHLYFHDHLNQLPHHEHHNITTTDIINRFCFLSPRFFFFKIYDCFCLHSFMQTLKGILYYCYDYCRYFRYCWITVSTTITTGTPTTYYNNIAIVTIVTTAVTFAVDTNACLLLVLLLVYFLKVYGNNGIGVSIV